MRGFLQNLVWRIGASCICLLSMMGTVYAQSPVEAGPRLLLPNAATDLPPLGPLETSTSPQSTSHSPPPSDAASFWVVSSRRCQIERAPETCSLDFFERSPNGCLLPRSRTDFLRTLSPDIPTCFVIHGSFVGWNSWLCESERTCRWLRGSAPDAPVRFVFFTWPSDTRITYFLPADVAILGRRSAYHSLFLGELIRELPPRQPVSLIGHSHGARLAVSALHLLGGGEVHGYRMPVDNTPRRLRAVFVAAAVDHHWLNPGERYSAALPQTEGVLNIRNGTDIALAFYPLRKPFGYEALGQSGFQQQDRLQLAGSSAKISELEVAPLLQTAHLWPNYYRRPELAFAFVPYVYYRELQHPSLSHQRSANRTTRLDGSWGRTSMGSQVIVPRRDETDLDIVPGLNLNVNLLPRR